MPNGQKPRIERYELIEEITKLVARRGTCLRATVGCVIEKDGRILSLGYNGSPPGAPHCTEIGCEIVGGHCVRTIHAEMNAICWAAREGISIKGARLFVYGWSKGICPACEKAARSSGIEFIHCIEDRPKP
jgi:dCMP deaminase